MKRQVSTLALIACFTSPALPGAAQSEAEQMITAGNQKIRENPSSYLGYAFRAMGEVEARQNDLALVDLRKGLSLNPGNAPCYVVYGMMAMIQENYQQAIEYADKACAVHPHLMQALEIKMRSYEKLGRMDMVAQVKAEAAAERQRRGDAYLQDNGFNDPVRTPAAATPSFSVPAQRPWLPPANNALLPNNTPSTAPSARNSFSDSASLFGGRARSFSTVLGAPSTSTTPAESSSLFGGAWY